MGKIEASESIIVFTANLFSTQQTFSSFFAEHMPRTLCSKLRASVEGIHLSPMQLFPARLTRENFLDETEIQASKLALCRCFANN